MKTSKIIISLLVVPFLPLLFGSCKKFITVELPKSLVPAKLVFENDITAGNVMNGLYAFMTDGSHFARASKGITLYTGLTADEVINNSQYNAEALQMQENQILSNNDNIYYLWGSFYQTIYRTNAIIEGVNQSAGITAAKKIQFEAEARFVRAFCYFYLVNTFGDVPLALSSDYEVNTKLSRSPQSQVYTQIIEDVKFSKENLSAEYPLAERIKPSQYAAIALLARVYLYLGDWSGAERESSLLIENTSKFGLMQLDQVFAVNNMEAIWQLNPARNATATGITGEANLFRPTTLDQFVSMRPGLWNSFETGDARKDIWTGESNGFYYPSKYKQLISGPYQEYPTIFRLAEQFLIRAEARAHLNKLTGVNSSESDINTIRERAGLPNTAAASEEELLDAIEKERRSELFIEWGHRWYDLKRWHKLTGILQPIKRNWSANDTIYPIPLSEYNKNPNLRPQNAGY